MSGFLKIFGGKKDKPPTTQEAIQKLRETEDMLVKKSDFLEKKVATELATAKKNGTKNKRVALMALKRKKKYEKQLQQIDGTLTTIEFQREALENASTNTEVLQVMGTAAKALRNAHHNMDIDKVQNLMDEVAEQQEVANEISEAISNPVGFGNEVDEDDLLLELEELEQGELNEQLLGIDETVTDKLPDVPSDKPERVPSHAAASTADEEDMKALEAWAS